MFRALCRSSSGTSTVLAATGLHTLAETCFVFRLKMISHHQA